MIGDWAAAATECNSNLLSERSRSCCENNDASLVLIGCWIGYPLFLTPIFVQCDWRELRHVRHSPGYFNPTLDSYELLAVGCSQRTSSWSIPGGFDFS